MTKPTALLAPVGPSAMLALASYALLSVAMATPAYANDHLPLMFLATHLHLRALLGTA
jgi:hypothetical protein